MADAETEIEVTPEILREFLDYDPETGLLTWKYRDVKWFRGTEKCTAQQAAYNWNARYAGRQAFTSRDKRKGYFLGGVLGRVFFAHRVAYAIMTGAWPRNTIDHADGNPSNNKWSNIRAATHSENTRNRRAYGASGYKGVSEVADHPGYFRCRFYDGSKLHYLGGGRDPEALARLWDKHAKELHGEFANLNFPDD